MASSDASIDDVLDDIQLYRAILESLDEQRPDAAEERQEILDVIDGLEKRLAELRGNNANNSNSLPPPSSQDIRLSSLAQAQLDGVATSDMNPTNLPQWGQLAMPPPSPRPRLDRPAQAQHLPPPKRRYSEYDVDLTDGFELPTSKRFSAIRPDPFPSRSTSTSFSRVSEDPDDGFGNMGDIRYMIGMDKTVTPSNWAPRDWILPTARPPQPTLSSPQENTVSDLDDMDELLQIFGMDSHDNLRELQEEQRKAERWLEERKEQERRDEEYARYVSATLEPPRPLSARSSSSTQYSGSSLPLGAFPSPGPRMDSRDLGIHQDFSQQPSVQLDFLRTKAPPHEVPFRPSHAHPKAQNLATTPLRDSDDSDIAEITPWEYKRVIDNNPSHLKRDRHINLGTFIGQDSSSQRGSNTASYRAQGPFGGHPPFGSHSPFGACPPLGVTPGPSGIRDPRSLYGPHVLQNTMARLNAGKQSFEHAGKSILAGYTKPIQSHSSLMHSYPGGMEYTLNKSLEFLSDHYEYGADAKQLNDEIKQLLETIRPDTEITKENREGTPEALKFTLLEHQKLGLAWMKSKEEQEQKGGILADDMGLGKTIQAISLIVSRPSTDPERKATLIIAPVALMQQWKREIERSLRPGKHQLTVYVLHGEKRSVSFRDLKSYDVVLTTFGTLSSELKRREKYDELLSSGAEEPTLTRFYLHTLPCLGPTSKWHRVVIDEAQCIKNRNTKSALACCRLNTTYRWCMSGTPMMNSVEELHSLLKFLRIRPYCVLETFSKDFTRPLKNGGAKAQEKAMTQLRILLKAVLLRRTKGSKIDGKPILPLLPRVSEKVHAVFSDDELELYTSLESKTQLQFNRYLEAGTVGRNYTNILVLLLRLRQACCHPHLITDFSVKLNANTDDLDLVANAKAFSDEVIGRLKDNNDLECPICIDAVENPIIFFPCGHGTCAECFSRISDPSLSLRQGIDGVMEVKCPNCRGKVDPKKITDHVSFRKVHFLEPSDDPNETGDPKNSAPDEDEDEDDEDDDSDDGSNSLSRFIVPDSDDGESRRKAKGKGKSTKAPRKTLAELKKEASKNQASKRKYLRRLEKTWISSAKIEKTMEILRGIQFGEDNEKTIVFSQFTSLLDLLEVPIAREGWRYRRYDGSMKPADRNSAVLDFTDDPDCRIMLVSLKAGNSGLNLVAASQVIIFDPFWNPYIEEQAIDRAHRIGQLRRVQIHRILVQNTVEDRILALQEKKRELIEGALDEKASKGISRLTSRELSYLFGIQ